MVWTQLYFGLGLTTLATLILELSLTRIFSVVFYYHFAFLAISVALFGLGAGGVFSYFVAARPGNLWAKLGWLALADALCVVTSLWFVLSRAGTPGTWTLALVYLAAAIPFFLAGTVVSLAISESVERVDRAYFFDLAGAASGCLLLIPFLNLFGGPNTVISAGVIYAVSAAVWFHQAGGYKRRATAVLMALLLTGLMIINGKTHLIDVRTAKGQPLPPERFVEWNSFSRVSVMRADVSWEPEAYWTVILDGDAGTGIAPFDFARGISPEIRRKLLDQGPGFPYVIRPGAKTLVIGPGGGYDVARALAGGSKDVTGVEINPIIANTIMRNRMLTESHGIYRRPEVHIAVEDGRSFVRRSGEKYQVIQATLVDTWASTAAGAFALSENNLYTSDAFYDYLSHLTDDGVLAFTRWGFDPPRESLRLITLGMDALKRLGIGQPGRHFLAIREDSAHVHAYGALDTVLISKRPFSEEDIAKSREFLKESGMEALYLPGDPQSNAFQTLLGSPDPEAFLRTYAYDVSPVTDDRPFFFYTVQPRDFWAFLTQASRESEDYKVNRAVPMLVGVVGLSVAATVLVLVLPRLLLGARLPKRKGVARFLGYFLCLGAGYILIQVALIQRFILLLGRPTYALTVIIFSMLVASGLGSYFSSRIASGGLLRVLGAIAALVTALAFAAGPLVEATATWVLAAKLLLSAIAVAPAAFLMGVPFPAGLLWLSRQYAEAIRWAWALNAAASVLGSALAILIAIYLGLRATMLAGAGLYLLALTAAWSGARAEFKRL